MKSKEEQEQCCGSCRWHYYTEPDDDWICTNPNSENYADFTEYAHSCEEYQSRREKA
jgi:hypothetical protein